MSNKFKFLLCASAIVLASCGGGNNQVDASPELQKISQVESPLPESTTQKQSSENRICIDQFQADRDICLSTFRGRERASCMQEATTRKNLCQAGELEPDPTIPDYIFTIDPAEIKTIAFSNFGFRSENGASQEDLSNDFEDGNIVISSTGQPGNLSNNEIEARVNGRELVIVAPVQPRSTDASSREQLFVLTADNGESVNILIRARQSSFGASIIDDNHFLEEFPSEEPIPVPTVSVTGFDGFGTIGQTDLILSLENGGPFISDDFEAFIFSQELGGQDITSLVTLDANEPILTLNAQALQGLLTQIPFGLSTLEFRLPQTENFNIAEVQFFNGQSVINGQLVDEFGSPVTPDFSETGSLEIVVTGANTEFQRIVNVNPDGSFLLENLPSGETYRLVVSDLRFPNLFGVFTAIFNGSTEANVELAYTPPSNDVLDGGVGTKSNQKGSAPASPTDPNNGATIKKQNFSETPSGQFSAGKTIQFGDIKATRNVPTQSLKSSSKNSAIETNKTGSACGTDIENGQRFEVISGGEGVTEQCNIDFTPEEGVTALDITVTVTTAEFPDFTQDQSQFDDAWSWNLSFPNAEGVRSRSESATVNNSHVSRGTTTEEFRINLPDSDDEDAEPLQLTVSGAITSQNVGDSAFQTNVSVEITEAARELRISRARFLSPNTRQNILIQPVNTSRRGNESGTYISLARNNNFGTQIQVPMEIEYTPDNTNITEFTLSVVENGNVVSTSENLIGNGITANNGKINSQNFTFPAFPNVNRTGNNIQLSVQLKGTIEGEEVETEEGENPLEFNGTEDFTPLFLASEFISGANRRFSGRDTAIGNDSWARSSMIDWLLADSNRIFNDISAQHIAQSNINSECSPVTTRPCSILRHGTHGDGSIVDIRYLNASGNGDANNNAAANQMRVNTAFAEFQMNETIREMIEEAEENGEPTDGFPPLQFTAQQALVSWITANRNFIQSASTGARGICVAQTTAFRSSDGTIGRALVDGEFSDGSDIINPTTNTAVGEWNSPSVVSPCNGHDTHFHIARN